MTDDNDKTELMALEKAISALNVLSKAGRAYLLDRFYSENEISIELKRRYYKRAQQPHAGDGATSTQSVVQALSRDSSGEGGGSKPPRA